MPGWYDRRATHCYTLMFDSTTPARNSDLYERIYTCVCAVPWGRVTSYGTLGHMVGCGPRVVGYALHHLRLVDRPDVPWQRVINARGMISTHGNEQRCLLEQEGVVFDEKGRVDFDRFGWP